MVGELFLTGEALFAIDSLPAPACHRARATRCGKVQERRFSGYVAAKRQIFFGWRVHLVVTSLGIPVSVTLLPASDHDLTCVHELLYPLPAGAQVIVEAAIMRRPVCDWRRSENGAWARTPGGSGRCCIHCAPASRR